MNGVRRKGNIMEQKEIDTAREKMEFLNTSALTYFLDSLKSLKSCQDLREQPAINRLEALS